MKGPAMRVNATAMIWIRDHRTHTPAHRVKSHNQGHYELACGPKDGGTIVTRAEAIGLETHWCIKCFREQTD